MEIDDGEVHVHYVFESSVTDPKLLAAYEALLSPDEQERRCRLVFAHHRQRFLLARALMRTVASAYADIDPAAWTFSRSRWGKPEIAGPEGARRVRLNLSDTEGLVACAVTAHADVGVDVEYTAGRPRPLEIASRYFSAAEVRSLRAVPPERQHDRFFELWTLKEAYLKARGLGLALPLGQFSIDLDGGPDIRISFGREMDDDPAVWRFFLARPSARHRLAVAVRSGAATPALRLLETVPLA